MLALLSRLYSHVTENSHITLNPYYSNQCDMAQLQSSSFLHYGLAYTVCLLFKYIWGFEQHIER